MVRFVLRCGAFVLLLCFAGLIDLLAKGKGKETQDDVFWVDDFESSRLGGLPKDWRGRSDEAKKFYVVAEEKTKGRTNRYLKVDNIKTAQFVGKAAKVDIARYPYLNWKWRVRVLPPKGDESVKRYCDVPASLNVVLEVRKVLGIPTPKTIKYSWSTTLKKGTVTKSPFAYWPSRCDIIVMRTGPRFKGRWVKEKRNVFEDYQNFYKLKNVKSKVIDLITVMSDADNTGKVAAADYDDIYFSKN